MPGPEAASNSQRARSACGEDLDVLIHEADPETLLALIENPNMLEPQISRLLERLDLSTELLEAIAKEAKWTSSESVRLGLARHPHTPRRIAIPFLRQLYLFDLVRLSLLPSGAKISIWFFVMPMLNSFVMVGPRTHVAPPAKL